jgi:predicted transcriptional regulator
MDDKTSIPAPEQSVFTELAANIVSAYVAHNSVPAAELPALLSGVHAAIAGLGSPSAPAEPDLQRPTPAQIRKSITPDALISFIDGKPYKTLKRHLTGHGMTIEEYRVRYGLPRDYPSTAASYSAMRAEFARSNGLGTQRGKAAAKTAQVAETVTEAPKTRGRIKAAEPAAKPTKTRRPKKAAAAA